MKQAYTITNADCKSNLLPRIMHGRPSDKWTIANTAKPELLSAFEAYMSETIGDVNEKADDDELIKNLDNAQAAANTFMQSWFVNKFGKRMISKYAGKTIDGINFDAGTPIVYWSNSVDRAVILQ